MKTKIIRIFLAVFSLSIIFCYGVGVGTYHLPPYSFLQSAKNFLISSSTVSNDTSINTPLRKAGGGVSYTVTTSRNSYYALGADGSLLLENELPYKDIGTYRFERTIDPSKTAVIVMDPWIDMVPDELNTYYGEITSSKIMPLVQSAINRGHPVIVLTNDPNQYSYDAKIYPALKNLADEQEIDVLYHGNFTDDSFAEYLKKQGIDSLIYTGFASNMCVIGRANGMISMSQHGFKLYFVPEASAAVGLSGILDAQTIHEDITNIISQWIAEIIHYNDFMNAEN